MCYACTTSQYIWVQTQFYGRLAIGVRCTWVQVEVGPRVASTKNATYPTDQILDIISIPWENGIGGTGLNLD